MRATLCSRCKKNVAVIFITKMENGSAVNEGLCLSCARELKIPQVNDLIHQMGLTGEDIDHLTEEMSGMMELFNNEAAMDG